MDVRTESDSMGEIQVPADRYWGAQTQRSLQHFRIGHERFPRVFLRAYALVKQAAAQVNAELGELDAERAGWIARAAQDVIDGQLDDHFPLVVWQTGSGTQTHMNLNEVIANRANELAGGEIGRGGLVHANDHVNRAQSTNDTFPTAMHVAAALALHDRLFPALDGLLERLQGLGSRYWDVIKIGRTHLQDATPLRLGQEFGGWAAQLRLARAGIDTALGPIYALAAGGTAVGTGLNAHPDFADQIAESLAEKTSLPFVSAPDKFAALAGHEPLALLSGALSNLAGALLKVANDVRWLASGPRSGLGELCIPENEPGSSIMPGKVNPTQCEALSMVCLMVMGQNTSVGFAASQGNLELNVYKPLITHCVLSALELLSDAIESFDRNCVAGMKPRDDRIAHLLGRSLMLVTALSPHIGYDAAARIAKKAHAEGCTLREAALALGLVSAEQFDDWVRPELMVGPTPPKA